MCGSWCLDPRLSPFLVKFTQILEYIFLDYLYKSAVLSVGCASFSTTLFRPLNFLLTCLDTALCEQLLWQWMFVAYPPCEGCQWLSSGQLSDQQSSPWLCSIVNQTERPFWRLRKPLQVFWVDILIYWDASVYCWLLVQICMCNLWLILWSRITFHYYQCWKQLCSWKFFLGEKKFQEQIFGNIINVFLVPFHKLYELFLNKRSKH